MEERVLLVDDDPATVSLVTDALTGAGFFVSSVTDALSCLNALQDDLPDLLILDVMLPDMDGFEVLATIRNNDATRRLPVMMLTARDRHQDKLVGWMSGADRYITKPFNVKDLVTATVQLLRPPAHG